MTKTLCSFCHCNLLLFAKSFENLNMYFFAIYVSERIMDNIKIAGQYGSLLLFHCPVVFTKFANIDIFPFNPLQKDLYKNFACFMYLLKFETNLFFNFEEKQQFSILKILFSI